MLNRLYSTLAIAIVFIISSATPLHAEISSASVQKRLQQFVNSSDHRFAPATAARVRSYLDAMRATEYETGQEAVAAQLLASADKTMIEARRIAASFQTKYADLLELVGAVKGMMDPSDARAVEIEQTLGRAISSMEKADLNKVSQHVERLHALCLMVYDERLPPLILKTGKAIAKAAAGGAKDYAPVYYETAKVERDRLKAYSQGGAMPPIPANRALRLAERAYEMSQQVRKWRKKPGSHSALVHEARMLKIHIAQALGLGIPNIYDPMAEVSEESVREAADQLRMDMESLKVAHKAEIARLQAEHARTMQEKITAMRSEQEQQQSRQIDDLKEAFRTKLDRETFEKRRSQRLREIFKSSKTDIMLRADGSILIRLTALHFPSGKSSLDRKYFPLLNQLKQAINLYREHGVRIEGHTDNTGDAKQNQRLSLQRAESVRDFLLATDANQSSIKAMGYGVAKPIASNDYEKGRTMNRRIDVVIEAKAQ